MNTDTTQNSSLVRAILLDLPWAEMLADTWKFFRKTVNGLAQEGMLEVLDYQTTLQLHDPLGEKATLQPDLAREQDIPEFGG